MALHTNICLHDIYTLMFVSADWQMVFLAKPGISTSTNFWLDWTSGSASTTDDPSCLDKPCSKHYRSSLIDSWSSDGIIKVS